MDNWEKASWLTGFLLGWTGLVLALEVARLPRFKGWTP
jgi:hypothetical protein